jgi:uncharacterized membrane protein
MKAIKIILGIFLIVGAINNVLNIGRMSKYEVVGYMIATLFFLFVGAFLLYSGLKPQPPSISISGDDQD